MQALDGKSILEVVPHVRGGCGPSRRRSSTRYDVTEREERRKVEVSLLSAAELNSWLKDPNDQHTHFVLRAAPRGRRRLREYDKENYVSGQRASSIVVHYRLAGGEPRSQELQGRVFRADHGERDSAVCSMPEKAFRELQLLCFHKLPAVATLLDEASADSCRCAAHLSWPANEGAMRNAMESSSRAYLVQTAPEGLCFFALQGQRLRLRLAVLKLESGRPAWAVWERLVPEGKDIRLVDLGAGASALAGSAPRMLLSGDLSYSELVSAIQTPTSRPRSQFCLPWRRSAVLHPASPGHPNKSTEPTQIIDQDSQEVPKESAAVTGEQEASVAVFQGDLGVEKAREMLLNVFGDPTEAERTQTPSAMLTPVSFWKQLYAQDVASLAELASLLEVMQVAMEWPSLRQAFVATGGPLWLTDMYLKSPGIVPPPWLPDEAALDDNLAVVEKFDATDDGGNWSSSGDGLGAALEEGWSGLEFEEEESRTWRVTLTERSRASNQEWMGGNEEPQTPPLALGPSKDCDSACPSDSDRWTLRSDWNSKKADGATHRISPNPSSNRTMTPGLPGDEPGAQVPKLPLGNIPKNGLTQDVQMTGRSSSAVGSLLWYGFVPSNAGGPPESVEAWLWSGSSIDLGGVLGLATASPQMVSMKVRTDDLISSVLAPILEGERRCSIAVVEAACVFLATAKGRAHLLGVTLGTATQSLELKLIRRVGEQHRQEAGAGGTSWTGTVLLQQLVRRCCAISHLEAKIRAVQQHRAVLQAGTEQRRLWIRQLCSCSTERSLYAKLALERVAQALQPLPGGDRMLKSSEDKALVMRSCCDVLLPMSDVLRLSSKAPTFVHLNAPTIDAVVTIMDMILEDSTDPKVETAKILSNMTDAESPTTTATAVLAAYVDWLLNPPDEQSIREDGGSPLQPVPSQIFHELRSRGVRFVRRLVEVCSELKFQSKVCDTSAHAAGRVLANLCAESASGMWFWLNTHAANPSMSADVGVEDNVLRTLIAVYSNRIPGSSLGTAKIAEPLVMLLRHLKSHGAGLPETPARIHTCLELLLAVTSVRGIDEAAKIRSSGALRFLLDQLHSIHKLKSITPTKDQAASGGPGGTLARQPQPGSAASTARSVAAASTARSAAAAPSAATTATVEVFEVGERVQGLWTLPGGKQRWFPGEITAIESGNSYTIRYNDGDVQSGKIESEIRRLRRGSRTAVQRPAPVPAAPPPEDVEPPPDEDEGLIPVVSVSHEDLDDDENELSSSEDSLFMQIPPVLSPRLESSRFKSLDIDLAGVRPISRTSSAEDTGSLSGFSSLNCMMDFAGVSGRDVGQATLDTVILTEERHCEVALHILLSLCVKPDGRCLERDPWVTEQILPALQSHLAATWTRSIVRCLVSNCQGAKWTSVLSLLKLLAPPLLDISTYEVSGDLQVLGAGKFGRVVAAPYRVPGSEERQVAIKICHAGQSVQRLFDEVTALTLLQGEASNAVQLMDFGFSLERNEYWVVMELCQQNLKTWRSGRQCKVTPEDVLLYLDVFQRVAEAVYGLAERGIFHLDLKCDNVLLRADPAAELTAGSICLGDFGEACVADAGNVASGVDRDRLRHARGTECIQSPEMLLIHSATTPSAASEKAADPQHRNVPVRSNYINAASDVWSLGCLLFELLTSEFLFDITQEEGGWARLFVTLTKDDVDLFMDRKVSLLQELPWASELQRLLRKILVKNPDDRPSATEVIGMIKDLRSNLHSAGHGER